MSSLPTLNLIDRQIRLPNHNEILNPEKPFCSKQHLFRPAKQIQATIADYASSLVSTIEALFQLRSKDGKSIPESNHRYKSYFRSWNPRFENGAKLGWKVVQAKEGDDSELRYLVSAEKPDGSKERFTVFKNPHEKEFRRAVWDINGFFPGKLVYDHDRLRLINPGVSDLGLLNSNYLNKSPEKSRINKVHRELVNHAQWLVDIVASPQYQINGGGKVIGRNKIYANKNAFGGKTIFLLNQATKGMAQASKTFSVETNDKNEIIEIRQFSSKAKYFIRIEKNDDDSIAKQAKVKIYYDDKKKSIIDDLMKLRAVEDLFKSTPGVIDINKIIAHESMLLAQLNGDAYADVFEINNSDEAAIKLQIKNALGSANNIRSIGSSTGLVGRPFGDEGQVPELLKQFYDYVALQPGQISFLFHDGGTNDAQMSYQGKTIPLRLLGPSSLRSPYSRSGEGQHILIDSKLEAFFKSVGVDVATEDQNKAILRWTLVHNEKALNSLGLYLERKDDKEIIHVINDASLETKIKNSKLIIPNAVSESKEITLTNLMNLNIFDEVKFGKDSPRPDHTKFSNVNAKKFYDVLKYIGFHVADPVETEEYFQTVINEDKVQKFIEDATRTGLNSYKAHLNLSLAQRFLAQDGYTDFQRVKTSAMGGEILECSKGDKQYLARSTALAYANHQQLTDLKERATEAGKIPLMIRLKNVDIKKRSATGYNFQ